MNITFRRLYANEIDCRAQSVKEKGCSLLLYKDARCDMRILDEQIGTQNWQREHYEAHGNLFCRVGIWDESKAQWVWKSDAGAPSNQDAEKGHASDSFKRACFNWGIGRELYTAGFIWIKLEPNEVSGSNGKYRLNAGVEFTVREINYTEDEIAGLVIVDRSGSVRYDRKKPNALPKNTVEYTPNVYGAKEYVKTNAQAAVKDMQPKQAATTVKLPCDKCGHLKVDEKVANFCKKNRKDGRILCFECQTAERKSLQDLTPPEPPPVPTDENDWFEELAKDAPLPF